MSRFRGRLSAASRDLVVIVVLAAVLFALAARYDLFALLVTWTVRSESLTLDDAATASLVLLVAFAIFALPR